MNDMVERVANALNIRFQAITGHAETFETMTKLARAAIESMREPTDEVLADSVLTNDKSGAPYVSDFWFFRSELGKLIDHALNVNKADPNA